MQRAGICAPRREGPGRDPQSHVAPLAAVRACLDRVGRHRGGEEHGQPATPGAASFGRVIGCRTCRSGVVHLTEDDHGLVKALTVIAVKEPAQFADAAQRLRDERAEKADLDALTAALTGAGVRIMERPGCDEKQITALARLPDSA